jgi:RNA polymerase sigma-B factor
LAFDMTTFSETHVSRPFPGSQERSDRTHELFMLAQSCDSEHERRQLMDTVIAMHLDYAHAQAARYRSRGVPLDDLQQVAAMALVKATKGYDVTSGHEFMAYAAPTIRGELRKHFRDHGWMIRPTRSVQELQARISTAEAELTQQHGHSPQPVEIAEHLCVPLECVIEALATDGCFTPMSLDHPIGEEGAFTTLGALLPDRTDGQKAAEARMMLDPVLRTLPERDRLILGLRFYEGLTQREVAQRIGVTQMQVSRLLTRILAQLRSRVGEVPLP